jgi:5-methylcytosine-specific restriction endonuclease McrA
MSRLEERQQILEGLREEWGYGDFDEIIRRMNRQRLQSNRTEERKTFTWSMYTRLNEKQRGVCPWCEKDLKVVKSEKRNLHIDHINPNQGAFNNPKNLQLLHASCNLAKSAMTMQEQSKHTGKTVEELLRGGAEPIEEQI